MSATLASPQCAAGITATLSSTTGSATSTTNISHQHTSQPTVGSSAGNVSKAWTGTITVTDSGTPNLSTDLTTGLTDPQGNALVFSKVQQMIFESLESATANIVTLFGGSNGLVATGTLTLLAGGKIVWDAGILGDGITVDSTHKIIQVATAAGTSVKVKTTILGR